MALILGMLVLQEAPPAARRYVQLLDARAKSEDDADTLAFKALHHRETLALFVPLACPTADVWVKEGVITLPGGDRAFEDALRRVRRVVDTEACTPRGAPRTAFERLASAWVKLSEAPEADLEAWLESCERLVRDGTVDADRRLAAVLWGGSAQVRHAARVTKDQGREARLCALEERLRFLSLADDVRGGEPLLRFGVALRRAGVLAGLERRDDARAAYASLLEGLRGSGGWDFLRAATEGLRRMDEPK
jgi:hypothetical protein